MADGRVFKALLTGERKNERKKEEPDEWVQMMTAESWQKVNENSAAKEKAPEELFIRYITIAMGRKKDIISNKNQDILTL